MLALKKLTLYVHPTCASSYRIVKYLMSTGKLGEVKIVNVSSDILATFKLGIFSVPFLFVEGEPIAADPLEPELVRKFVEGGDVAEFAPKNLSEAYSRLVKSILSSSYVLIYTLVHGKPDLVTGSRFFDVASRLTLARGLSRDELMDLVRRNWSELLGELRRRGSKIIAANLLRELYWSSGSLSGELIRSLSDYVISAWLIGKVSIGRAGIPVGKELSRVRELARTVLEVLLERGSELISKVVEEQRKIESDRYYLGLLST